LYYEYTLAAFWPVLEQAGQLIDKLKAYAPFLFSNIKSLDRTQTKVLTPDGARELRLRAPTN
jgi:hypothetical protein